MLSLIIIVVITIIAACWAAYYTNRIIPVLPMIVLSIIATTILAQTVSVALSPVLGKQIEIDRYNIASLCTTESVNGSFILGCGTIHNTLTYTTIAKLGGNRFRRIQLVSNDIVILETNSTPCVIKYKLGMNSKYFLPAGTPKFYVIRVPPGTIIKQFKIE